MLHLPHNHHRDVQPYSSCINSEVPQRPDLDQDYAVRKGRVPEKAKSLLFAMLKELCVYWDPGARLDVENSTRGWKQPSFPHPHKQWF